MQDCEVPPNTSSQAFDALGRSLGDYVCPLYTFRHSKAFLVGSGVPLRIGGADFIATAAHVLEEAEQDYVITVGGDELVALRGEHLLYRYIPEVSIDADVALVRLSPAEAAEVRRRFSFTSVPSDVGQIASYSKLIVYIFVGFPHSYNRPRPRSVGRIRSISRFVVLREFVELSDLPSAGKRGHVHFAFATHEGRRTKAAGARFTLPKSQGMSGGGIWRVDFNERDGSMSLPKLVGVGIEHVENRAFIATGVEWLVRIWNEDTRSVES